MVEAILPDLWRFKSRRSGPQQPVNSYIWRCDDRFILIDPAIDCASDYLPLDLPVTDILVTHVQNEHAAGAAHYPDASIYVPFGDAYLCSNPDFYRYPAKQKNELRDWGTLRGVMPGYMAGAPNERPLIEPVVPTGYLADGDTIAGAKIIATPGQGKHAVTIVASISSRRVAFCGDLIFHGGRMWNWFDSEWDYGLQTGQQALHASVVRLAELGDLLLCPAHGEPIHDSVSELQLLSGRLDQICRKPAGASITSPINFIEKLSAPGFRELSPHLHQWTRNGSCAVLLSDTGGALLVDDGLCHWVDLPERKRHHDAVMQTLKETLNITRIEVVVPTHYHGDHIENIPDIVATDDAEVVCLDVVADAIDRGHTMGLAASLPWYGTAYDTVPIDRRIESGHILKWHEYELEIFHLGGQTYYHLGVSVKVDGLNVLFVGDAMHLEIPPGDAVICFNDAEPYERGWAFALDQIGERKPDLLVCGHASAIIKPAEHIDVRRLYWRTVRPFFEAINPRRTSRAFFDPFYLEPEWQKRSRFSINIVDEHMLLTPY